MARVVVSQRSISNMVKIAHGCIPELVVVCVVCDDDIAEYDLQGFVVGPILDVAFVHCRQWLCAALRDFFDVPGNA